MKRIKTERSRRDARVVSPFWQELRPVGSPGRPKERDPEHKSGSESRAAQERVEPEQTSSVACPWVSPWNPPSLRNGAQALRQARPDIVPSKGLGQLQNDAPNGLLDHHGHLDETIAECAHLGPRLIGAANLVAKL